MNETLQNLQVGDHVRVKIANSYEYGTVTGIEHREVLIQLSSEPYLTGEVSFKNFIEMDYEVIVNR